MTIKLSTNQTDKWLEDIVIDYTPGMALDNAIYDVGHCLDHKHVFSKKAGKRLEIALANLKMVMEEYNA